jgi:hypothetical protein
LIPKEKEIPSNLKRGSMKDPKNIKFSEETESVSFKMPKTEKVIVSTPDDEQTPMDKFS